MNRFGNVEYDLSEEELSALLIMVLGLWIVICTYILMPVGNHVWWELPVWVATPQGLVHRPWLSVEIAGHEWQLLAYVGTILWLGIVLRLWQEFRGSSELGDLDA